MLMHSPDVMNSEAEHLHKFGSEVYISVKFNSQIHHVGGQS